VPIRLRGRDVRVPAAALAAVVAFVLVSVAVAVAWQHRQLAYATTLDTHDEAALLAPPPPQQVDDTAVLASLLTPVAYYHVGARFGQHGPHWVTRHTGFDFVAPTGTPVRAIQNGTVIKLAWNNAYGKMIILQVSPGITVWYCHLSSILVKPGPVKVGQMIGRVGSTGNSTGPHLHLEVRVDDRPTDPETYLFGPEPGRPGPAASWYPHPGLTLAMLQPLHGH
jgi:murein DD-endopeptidase MepM/ murein hydrolase activator NlpD